MYKSLTKRKKIYYINREQEHLLNLFKVDPRKLWRKIIICKMKENNLIPLKSWDIYLKSLYESLNAIGTILHTPIEEDIFSL